MFGLKFGMQGLNPYELVISIWNIDLLNRLNKYLHKKMLVFYLKNILISVFFSQTFVMQIQWIKFWSTCAGDVDKDTAGVCRNLGVSATPSEWAIKIELVGNKL